MATPDEAWIHDALRSVGYWFLQFEVSLPGFSKNLRPDVVAWAANADGTLVPWAVIEIKNSGRSLMTPPLSAALSSLATARDLLGTVEHYVVSNRQWFKADSSLRELGRVDGPSAPEFGGRGRIEDADLATSLVMERLWQWADKARAHGRPPAIDDFLPQHELEASAQGIETRTGDIVPASREVLWEARRRAFVESARRGPARTISVSHPVIASAVAALAGKRLDHDVFDPFCGTGSFLWSAIEYARDHGMSLSTALGFDIDPKMVQLARTIAAASPVPADLDPAGDLVMVGAGQHEQTSGDQVVAGVDPRRPCAHHYTGYTGGLGEQVTTATGERPQLCHGLVDRAAGAGEPDRSSGQPGAEDAVGVGLPATGGHGPSVEQVF